MRLESFFRPVDSFTATGRGVEVGPGGIYSGIGPFNIPPSSCLTPAPLVGGRTYRFLASAKGGGWLKISLVLYCKDGGIIKDVVFDGVLPAAPTSLFRQIIAPPEAWQYRFLMSTGKGDTVIVDNPRLELIDQSEQAQDAEDTRAVVYQSSSELSAKNNSPRWVWPDLETGPDQDIINKTRRARWTHFLDVAFRAGKIVDLNKDSDKNNNQLVVEACGRGRVECYIVWGRGSEVTYIGMVSPYGEEGEVVLPFQLPQGVTNVHPLFMMIPGAEELTIKSVRIERLGGG